VRPIEHTFAGANLDATPPPLARPHAEDPLVRRLAAHLGRYGIVPVLSELDFDHLLVARVSDSKLRRETELAVRGPSARRRKGTTEKGELPDLYDLVADPLAGPVVLGRQAGAMLASGAAVTPHLAGRRRVLDLGCGVGHLATWYASLDPRRHVTGVDASGPAVERARVVAAEIGVPNVTFVRVDLERDALPEGPFDAVVETQTLYHCADLPGVLRRVRAVCAPDAVFVAAAKLPTAKRMRPYLAALRAADFGVAHVGATPLCRTLAAEDYQAYPVVVARAGAPAAPGAVPDDLDAWYGDLIRALLAQAWQDLLDQPPAARRAHYEWLCAAGVIDPAVRTEADLSRLVARCADAVQFRAEGLEEVLWCTGWGHNPYAHEDCVVLFGAAEKGA
jgi:2-polyprenyl-3-methyl-5-hydroxy-6-metoxy-1,4-benzoquinol methylase